MVADRSADWFRQAERDLEQAISSLDSFYIPTRHANGPPEGAPFEHFGSLQSEEAIRYAREIIEFVRARLAAP